ncbi:MAG: class I SAM-dependent methyltransferase [Ignavibacteriae bacterium]|nr:class I SAM-dependent methyltransferase [Ignavibacteriota bacterium]
MIKNLGKEILNSKLGNKIFRKFYYLSVEMDLMHPDLDEEFVKLKKICTPHTMTSLESLYYTYRSVKYAIENNIPGDFIECGVWKGGNTMMVALTLMNMKSTDRKIYLYDTFEGMSAPTEKDVSYKNEDADIEYKESQKGDHNEWCYSPLDEVKNNLYSTGYPKDKIVFVKGKVEDTIPGTLPEKIAILRLDTDWYESTYHELVHLYPLLSEKGFLIIDDYGYWQGAREAVEQYFKENNVKMFMNRLDMSARAGIKV